MKKIYYLQKIEVELGDLIAYKGFKSIVTEELINLNPGLFRVEILPLKFTTEDGVNIYGDMKTYMVYSNLTMSNKNINNGGTNSAIKYFYHKENALAYIKRHKEKSLGDYENTLLASNFFMEYHWLKDNEPKLYYTKILQLIADDLNDGWVADFSDNKAKWYVGEDDSDWVTQRSYGFILFKTKDLAEKARVILGDKVKNIFD